MDKKITPIKPPDPTTIGEASDWRSRYDRFGPAVCPYCWGMGFMRVDVEPGQAGFGTLVKCERSHAPSPLIRVVDDYEEAA